MRGLGRQTLEPWKFTNSQTPCFSATTENRRKHSFEGRCSRPVSFIPKTNQTKPQVPHACLKSPRTSLGWEPVENICSVRFLCRSCCRSSFQSQSWFHQQNKGVRVENQKLWHQSQVAALPFSLLQIFSAATHTAGFCTARQISHISSL